MFQDCRDTAARPDRASKGMVVRKLTIERFRDVIEEMYKENDYDLRK